MDGFQQPNQLPTPQGQNQFNPPAPPAPPVQDINPPGTMPNQPAQDINQPPTDLGVQKPLKPNEEIPEQEPKKKSSKFLIVLIIILVLAIIGGLYYYFAVYKKSKQTASPTPEATTSNQTDLNGPYYHKIFSASSKDGLTWTLVPKMLFDHSAAPGAITKDKTFYMYFVDASSDENQLSVATSTDSGKTFTKKQVTISGVNGDDILDPNPVFVDGKVMLYYVLGSSSTSASAPSTTGTTSETSNTSDKSNTSTNLTDTSTNSSASTSATSQTTQGTSVYVAESTDGISFSNPQKAYSDTTAVKNPDVIKIGTEWKMLLTQNLNMILLTSVNGTSFTKDSKFTWDKSGNSSTLKMGEIYRTYFCSTNLIKSATGINNDTLTEESGDRVKYTGATLCNPSVIQLPDSSYLMTYDSISSQPQTQSSSGTTGTNGTDSTTSE